MTRILLFFSAYLILFCPFYVYPQLQDSLGEVRITGERIKDSITDVRSRFTAGQQLQTISKKYQSLYEVQSLVNLLSQQSPVFIKSYGVNGMATLTFRGASAAQSSVLWNGVPILNPALGVADISLLSTGLFDQVSLQYGGSAALFGSSNVGGALMLDAENPDFKPSKQADIILGTGSFGRLHTAVKSSFQNKRWRLKLHSFYQQLNNNFPYTDEQGHRQEMDHARLQAAGVLLSTDIRLGKTAWHIHKQHTLSVKFWWQQYDREIPPALFEYRSRKLQDDASLRSLIHWQKTARRHQLYYKTSLNRERLQYSDEAVSLQSQNLVTQYYQEAGWRWQVNEPGSTRSFLGRGQHNLLIFSPLQFAVAKGDHISDKEQQWRPAIAGSLHFQSGDQHLATNLALRQEWVNGVASPLLPGGGFTFQVFSGHEKSGLLTATVRGNVQRTFRIPNLNELYYFPGGNPDLKPEQGWSSDAGYSLNYQTKRGELTHFSVQHDISVFNRHIQDWVYWLGGNIWTPHNIASVHSRGLETDNQLAFQVNKKWQVHMSVKTAYVLATTETSYLPNDNSKDKQIPYTPRYNGQGNLGFSFLSLFVNYNHTYTGYRFTTIDESQFLQPYQTGNLQLMYTLVKGGYTIKLTGQVHNLWDAAYEVVYARPMPGRNYVLSMQLGWQK